MPLKFSRGHYFSYQRTSAGIYYAQDSWKARLCVRGREQLYEFCDAYGVPYRKCGKLIVAHEHQVRRVLSRVSLISMLMVPSSSLPTQAAQLRAIGDRGRVNGVGDLKLLSKHEARELEPEVDCHEALWSPSTGIVDSHALMLALQGDAEAHGAVVVHRTEVKGCRVEPSTGTFVVQASTTGESEVEQVECDYFVNSTGLFAPYLVEKVDGYPSDFKLEHRPTVPTKLAKGTYFKLGSQRPFR